MPAADTRDLIFCHDCDQLQRLPATQASSRIRCVRCGGSLRAPTAQHFTVPLALAISAAFLLLLTHTFPLLDFTLQGRREVTYLLDGIWTMTRQGQPVLALIVALTTVVIPVLQVSLLLQIYLPLARGRQPAHLELSLRMLQALLPWSMLEIFMLGVLIATVKLAEQATIVPGAGAWALGALIFVLAGANTKVHPEQLWGRVR